MEQSAQGISEIASLEVFKEQGCGTEGCFSVLNVAVLGSVVEVLPNPNNSMIQ